MEKRKTPAVKSRRAVDQRCCVPRDVVTVHADDVVLKTRRDRPARDARYAATAARVRRRVEWKPEARAQI